MKLGLNPPKKVPFYAHPNITLVASGMGLVGGILVAYAVMRIGWQVQSLFMEMRQSAAAPLELLWPLRFPWVSLALGIVVGLPIMLIEKRMMHSRINFYADFCMMPLLERLRWPVLSTNLLACLPIILGPLLAVGMACILRIAPWPSFFGISIWSFLIYPEQKSIYEMAASRLQVLNHPTAAT